jgi:hypothetical protein
MYTLFRWLLWRLCVSQRSGELHCIRRQFARRLRGARVEGPIQRRMYTLLPLTSLLTQPSQCGEIRDLKLIPLGDSLVATVEFVERVSPCLVCCDESHMLILLVGLCSGCADQGQETHPGRRSRSPSCLAVDSVHHKLS